MKHYVEKKEKVKVIGRTLKGYASAIWGKSPSKLIVTNCGLWVPLPNIINCANFHLYGANSFWIAGPRKLGVTIELTFTTARAQASSVVIVKYLHLMLVSKGTPFSLIQYNTPFECSYVRPGTSEPTKK